MIYNESGDNMKLNKKGFTLVELLTVMVILVTILLIAIPSITSSLSRSEKKQLDAKKDAIKADVNINLKRSSFVDNTSKPGTDGKNYYTEFKEGRCLILVKTLYDSGHTSKEFVTNKKGDYINWCVKYDSNKYVIEDCPNSYTGCELS